MSDLTTTQSTANTSGTDGKNTADTTEDTTTQATAENRTYTQAELQSELDRIAAKTRTEEREKARKSQDEANKRASDEKLKADGEWQKIAEANQKESERLASELAKRDKDAIRAKVAASVFKNSAQAASAALRLVGETEEELLADAKELQKTFLVASPPDDLGRHGQQQQSGASMFDRIRTDVRAEQDAKAAAVGKSLDERLGRVPVR